jgi:hypothetical protein
MMCGNFCSQLSSKMPRFVDRFRAKILEEYLKSYLTVKSTDALIVLRSVDGVVMKGMFAHNVSKTFIFMILSEN